MEGLPGAVWGGPSYEANPVRIGIPGLWHRTGIRRFTDRHFDEAVKPSNRKACLALSLRIAIMLSRMVRLLLDGLLTLYLEKLLLFQ
jgi:hypothetical protein